MTARDRWLEATPDQRADVGPEAIATCGRALALVAERLAEMGYPVEDPLRPCPALDDELAPFREEGVIVPPALLALWREVGTISFVDLGRYRHVAFWDRAEEEWWRANPAVPRPEVTRACDGIVIDGPADEGWVDYVVDTILEMTQETTEAGDDAGDGGARVGIELGPDDLHKDNVSGSGPYELLLPRRGDDPWLAPLDGFAWGTPRPSSAPPDPPDLVSYLRTALLECGGFPGLYGNPAHADRLRILTANLPVF